MKYKDKWVARSFGSAFGQRPGGRHWADGGRRAGLWACFLLACWLAGGDHCLAQEPEPQSSQLLQQPQASLESQSSLKSQASQPEPQSSQSSLEMQALLKSQPQSLQASLELQSSQPEPESQSSLELQSSQPEPESVYAGEPRPSYASEVATEDRKETRQVYQEQQVDVAEIVFGHIGDAYEWHITDIGGKALTVPLPILVHSSTGWHCFLSSRFHEGDGVYEGLCLAREGEYKGKVVERVKVAETAVKYTSEAVPGTALKSVSESVSGTASKSASGSVSGTALKSASGSVSGTALKSASGSVPGTASKSVSESVSESFSRTALKSASESVSGSVPGTALKSASASAVNPIYQEVRPLDLSLTKNVAGLLINSAVLLALVLGCARWYRRHPVETEAPGGLVGMVEATVVFLRDEVIAPCIGPDYRRYQPYLLTVFFFILVSNLMGLLPMFPGGVNLTGNIAVTMVLALCTFIAVNVGGNRLYWKEIFWPDVPWWLKVPVPLMPFIELFGIFTKPLALMIRLFANIMAGHAAILSLLSIVFITAPLGAWINGSMGLIAVVFGVFMTALELLVAFIQAYVFTLLSAVFIGLSRPQKEAE